ncbi:MAG TPA: glycosyltransferase [Pyrinomonadaceae bacterium]|nr:glycosyltransferase [Pyrinomonadaceae bacterium]
MKINWFSPLEPASTDIAHYTGRVLPALIKRARVTVWTDQAEWDKRLEDFCEVRRFNPSKVDWAEMNRADMCVYNIGNNPLFHGAIWQLSRRHAGIVILHDIRLHHFFDGLYRVAWHDLPAYLNAMRFYYGEEGARDAAECFAGDARNIDYMAEKYPLTEHATENACGVLVHTREAFEKLKAESLYPVAYAPLPFDSSHCRLKSRLKTEALNFSSISSSNPQSLDAPFRLIVFGYLGRNRRLDSILEALAALPERERFRLDIYGEILVNERRLRARIRALGLKKMVTLHGFASEPELDAALSRSSLAINLRYPTMGEASGSQLRIWSHALPSMVSRTGWYATLPGEAVSFVDVENEQEEIQTHLKDFLKDPSRFALAGQKGREILERFHSPDIYADAIINLVGSAQRFRPRAALLKLARASGARSRDLFGRDGADKLLREAAEEIYALGAR